MTRNSCRVCGTTWRTPPGRYGKQPSAQEVPITERPPGMPGLNKKTTEKGSTYKPVIICSRSGCGRPIPPESWSHCCCYCRIVGGHTTWCDRTSEQVAKGQKANPKTSKRTWSEVPAAVRERILNRPKPEGEPPKRKRRPRRRAQSETSHVSPTAPWKKPRPEGERGTSRHRAPQENQLTQV